MKLKEKLLLLSKEKLMVTIIKKGMSKKKAKMLVDEAVNKSQKKDIKRYAGILNTKIDPLEYQKKIRDEWE
ncbi:hypothetical protein [Mongoliitalea daihaiensis]|uniref:hypothetical protein n=1 Tax=Mongoliitalea daihaiensis TaxID=2782006 RepID=UPI001F3CD4DB|nr:hypothetical protein [Mongoliitalea daihaiensis]UJP63342.1 hypothetical protein IPZ59_10815 [Mongoliitalea daihaiensis]